ncbi:hypothetical protein N0V93_001209 [Gnomoniopsis smithogilvyi]|uniref:CAP-Gly domain-containing protein n=1 Tax=Gnomoniopsis smithogilvyi TaxID=1191159 RepID=A0A9W8Z3J1_9PEZI|nr:hypothetical protein N0V93_001209 [Gnomoniopsis smithogilvyi]
MVGPATAGSSSHLSAFPPSISTPAKQKLLKVNNTSTSTSTPRALRRPTPRKASGIGKIITASTPNLRGAYSADPYKLVPSLAPAPPAPSLQRKGSAAALSLTSSSLAALPDASDSYALATLNSSSTPPNNMAPSPLTPRAGASFASDLSVGDRVEVPGNMLGMVRFIGAVQGKKGIFTGVELLPEFAARGKNNGDVDGVSYFTTSIAGAGIFLPLNKAIKRESPESSTTNSLPATPRSAVNGLKAGSQNSTNYTPPTPATAQYSKTLGPRRASSPQGKQSRPSLSRPESPMRKLQITPGARPSLGAPMKSNTNRFPSPTQTKFSQSLRGPATPGDLNKGRSLQAGNSYSNSGPRSGSALSGRSQGLPADDDTMSVGNGITRPRENGRVSALRGPSRQGSAYDEELERLRAEVADRDRQLKDQQAALTEMESSLIEVQGLMEQAELPPAAAVPARRGSLDDKDTAQLRALLEERNKKIAMLTAEFDAHRADFRSTIDTLELASTETERVYEKKIEELMQDILAIQERNSDVDAVASQLKQLEELVQELEEGLEDARRGEAEARGEVEFLRGEVERTRAELRREREKAAGGANGANGVPNGDHSALFKELEQKEDEIRGLKAIIHSLSRDSVPGEERPPASTEDTSARENLEFEVAELRALLDTKNTHEKEMERELEQLRRGSASTLRNVDQGSQRDSRDTVVAREPENNRPSSQHKLHQRVRTLDTTPESDGMSSITENSTLWCELCETSGHDILTCTNMFGGGSQKADPPTNAGGLAPINEVDQYKVAPLSPRLPPPPPESKPEFKPPPPNMLDPGPVAGKESGIIDPEAWCALCEKDGHNSVDCPFEDDL